MSLGKDSIQKRVAKPAAAPATRKAPAKKTPTASTVLPNVSPETVKKVVGYKEAAVEKFGLGEDLPYYLL